MQKRKGFTLIELLIVVLIMGILASVAMPQYFKSVEKSRSAEAITILSSIASAQERAYMQKGTYTSSLSELDVGISHLSYFTLIGVPGALTTMQRTINAGGGLNAYKITLRLPNVPGTLQRSWYCSPLSAGCQAMLPM